MYALLAVAILVTTLALVPARPREVNEAWWAVLGGGLTLVLGIVSFGQAWGILRETEDAILLLIGMMALSAVAEKAGFFDWAASLTARAGRGRTFLLYGFVFLVGTLVTTTLSLDATAIVLTPIVYGMVVRLRLSPLPFMFACVYTANTASLFLPVSNLTNLLAYGKFDLGFARFGLVMLLPGVFAVLTNFLVFAWLFRNDLRGSYKDTGDAFSPESRGFFGTAAVGIAGVLMAFFVAPIFGVPIGLVALAAGAVWWWSRGSRVGSASGRWRVRSRGGYSSSWWACSWWCRA